MPSSDSHFNTVHGFSVSKNAAELATYRIWKCMRQRCNYSGHKSYVDYGARGIKVCARWDDFSNFVADMGLRPPGMTLGRIDNEVGYGPDNCRWETMKEQQRNRRSNVFLTAFGRTQTLIEWAEEFDMGADTLAYRLRERSMPLEDALLEPIKPMKSSRRNKREGTRNVNGKTLKTWRIVRV